MPCVRTSEQTDSRSVSSRVSRGTVVQRHRARRSRSSTRSEATAGTASTSQRVSRGQHRCRSARARGPPDTPTRASSSGIPCWCCGHVPEYHQPVLEQQNDVDSERGVVAYSVAGHSTKSSWYSAMEYAKKSNSFSSHSEDAGVSEKLLSATPFVQVATERCKQGNTIQTLLSEQQRQQGKMARDSKEEVGFCVGGRQMQYQSTSSKPVSLGAAVGVGVPHRTRAR